MPKVLLEEDVPFQTEGRLLQELGLRLVASPQVALVELIKNAYDADSPSCDVRLEDNEQTLVVEDRGSGMTFDDFTSKWMRIATSSKANLKRSPLFKRRLTGAKGIGRFAVRFLGDMLHMTSIAYDATLGFLTCLDAEFDWVKLDQIKEISKVAVHCTVTKAPLGCCAGTTLRISSLRESIDFTKDKILRANVLQIVTPLQGLNRGRFSQLNTKSTRDPGFTVTLPGDDEEGVVDLAELVLDNYWARLNIELKRSKLKIVVQLHDSPKLHELVLSLPNSISNGFYADIRYFPRRKGVFAQKGISGPQAWSWVRSNCGIKVVDHGFHIHPYGFEKDDWLQLDLDTSHNERQWRTTIARTHFPISSLIQKDPAANPALNLSSNFQVVGAVFIETRRKISQKREVDLFPAMDREGLLSNRAFSDLREFVRAGIEFLAHVDKRSLLRKAEAEAKQVAKNTKAEIQEAISYIQNSPTLTAADKSRITKQYVAFAERVEEQEEYSSQARRSLTTMGLLGVVAGFMTHESRAIVHDLEMAIETLKKLAKSDAHIQADISQLQGRLNSFRGYLDYSRLFVQSVRTLKEVPLSALSQINRVLERFGAFASDRGIKVSVEVDASVRTPPMPVTVYSGIILNLYTNAVKGILSAQESIKHPHISFRSWNEPNRHILEVADNGIGIPPELRRRVFDPLFTTTSDIGNPLGSGMGLGLTLIEQVAKEFKGSVILLEKSPPGFSTCFRVTFSRSGK